MIIGDDKVLIFSFVISFIFFMVLRKKITSIIKTEKVSMKIALNFFYLITSIFLSVAISLSSLMVSNYFSGNNRKNINVIASGTKTCLNMSGYEELTDVEIWFYKDFSPEEKRTIFAFFTNSDGKKYGATFYLETKNNVSICTDLEFEQNSAAKYIGVPRSSSVHKVKFPTL